jgi:hypothetical protein
MPDNRIRFGIAALIITTVPWSLLAAQKIVPAHAHETAASMYFEPKLQIGQRLGNMFSRATS